MSITLIIFISFIGGFMIGAFAVLIRTSDEVNNALEEQRKTFIKELNKIKKGIKKK